MRYVPIEDAIGPKKTSWSISCKRNFFRDSYDERPAVENRTRKNLNPCQNRLADALRFAQAQLAGC
jgi:hypothetical protein